MSTHIILLVVAGIAIVGHFDDPTPGPTHAAQQHVAQHYAAQAYEH